MYNQIQKLKLMCVKLGRLHIYQNQLNKAPYDTLHDIPTTTVVNKYSEILGELYGLVSKL